jgi:ADP-ribosylglycohydrolase
MIYEVAERHHELRLQRAALAAKGTHLGDCFGQTFFKPEEEAINDIATRKVPEAIWPYTDDTVMTAGVLEVSRERGIVDQDRLASIFAKRYLDDPGRGYGATAQSILRRIGMGEDWRVVAPSVFSGMGSHGNGAAMRAAPIGGYFSDNLDECAGQARASAEVTHANIDGQAGAIAVAIAAALASEQGSAAGPEMIETAKDYLPACETRRKLETALNLDDSASVALAASVLGVGHQLSSHDTVPFALWCASKCLFDFEAALWFTVSALGDRDTTCAIVGGIVALAVGEGSLPSSWEQCCERF